MNPKWFIGLFMFFLISAFCSAVIEKQDMLSSGATDKTTFDKLFGVTKVITTDNIGNVSITLAPIGEFIDAFQTVILCDYSFVQPSPTDSGSNFLGQIYKYIMWCITFGILITFVLYIGSVIRGGA